MPGKYNRQDALYQKAKDSGYRSRAAYKLLELDEKHRLIKQGSKILDLGCWPGGWLQVAAGKTGPKGLVVGIDLKPVEKLPQGNVVTLVGDAGEGDKIEELRQAAGGYFDVVLSDMSPKLCGVPEVDSCAAAACGELALRAACQLLRTGGSAVIKVFKNSEVETFVKTARPLFNKLIRSELEASRKTSNEFYLIGLGFKKVETDHAGAAS